MYPAQIKNRVYFLLLAIILGWMLIYSFSTLTTRPRFWIDEAKSIELARNWQSSGKLDIETAPGVFSGFPELLQSTGYPVTVPLAYFFKIFGFGLVQARIFMLIWMMAFLLSVFFIGREIFGSKNSILALLLISTFASFYDSGRTVVGEIPGLLFLLFGLYAQLKKDNYLLGGFWLGLAIVAKPSVYGLIIPAGVLSLLLEKENWRDFWKKIFSSGLGMIPAAIGWIAVNLENPLSAESWSRIAGFYQNPYSAVSIGENIIRNLSNAPFSSTLIYFGFWFLILGLAYFLIKEKKQKSLLVFALLYGIFAFAYYLRSPGWLRYILPAELLILFFLPEALLVLFERFSGLPDFFKISSNRLLAYFVIFLTVVQIGHLFTSAQIFTSDSEILASELLNREFSRKSVGVINSLTLSALLKTDKRFQNAEMAGIPAIGKNPLFIDSLPEVIAFLSGENLSEESRAVLENRYILYSQTGGYYVYILKNKPDQLSDKK